VLKHVGFVHSLSVRTRLPQTLFALIDWRLLMNKDSQAIAAALKAATEHLSADDARFDAEVFRFADSRLSTSFT